MSNVIKEPTRMGALLYPVLISNNNIFIDAEVIEVVRAVKVYICFQQIHQR
jgi:hypothetical protein